MLSIYTQVSAFLATRKNDEKGATAVEYALVIGLVSVVLVGALVLFGPKIQTFVGDMNFGGGTPTP